MGGGKGVVDIEVEEGGEGTHQPGVLHLLGCQLHFLLEGCDLFTQIPKVSQKHSLSFLQRLYRLDCRRTADIIKVGDRFAGQTGEDGCMFAKADQVLVVQAIALVGDDGHLGPSLKQMSEGGRCLLKAVGVDNFLGCLIDGAVDVRAEQYEFALEIKIIEASHANRCYFFHVPIPK